jgi:hypothetical protein
MPTCFTIRHPAVSFVIITIRPVVIQLCFTSSFVMNRHPIMLRIALCYQPSSNCATSPFVIHSHPIMLNSPLINRHPIVTSPFLISRHPIMLHMVLRYQLSSSYASHRPSLSTVIHLRFTLPFVINCRHSCFSSTHRTVHTTDLPITVLTSCLFRTYMDVRGFSFQFCFLKTHL